MGNVTYKDKTKYRICCGFSLKREEKEDSAIKYTYVQRIKVERIDE